jgi:hypothetical protein
MFNSQGDLGGGVQEPACQPKPLKGQKVIGRTAIWMYIYTDKVWQQQAVVKNLEFELDRTTCGVNTYHFLPI